MSFEGNQTSTEIIQHGELTKRPYLCNLIRYERLQYDDKNKEVFWLDIFLLSFYKTLQCIVESLEINRVT